ncbi:MAG TPA: hypothetical protein VII49_04490 [Rhizomicrobium sp.]
MKARIYAALAGGAIFAAAGVAAAGNFTSSADNDFFSGGRHQFYVWCASSHNALAIESGANAEDAQLKLYRSLKASGRTTCWPVWQGRISG